jgi:preprotein translocase subunit SecE
MEKSFFKKVPEFINQVKLEGRKVTWPSAKETKITTLMVFVLAIVAAIYFMIVDQVIYRILHMIIG